jgi:hypothetical protein
MRFVAALVLAFLSDGALAQGTATGTDHGSSTSPAYGGGSAYDGGSSGYAGRSIGSPEAVEAGSKPAAEQQDLGGNYRYGDRQPGRRR